MKKLPLLLLLLLLLLVWELAGAQNRQLLTRYVQPLSGTDAPTTRSALKHGHGTELNANTVPAPFGMTQWPPQTQNSETKCVPPYLYKNWHFSGFRSRLNGTDGIIPIIISPMRCCRAVTGWSFS